MEAAHGKHTKTLPQMKDTSNAAVAAATAEEDSTILRPGAASREARKKTERVSACHAATSKSGEQQGAGGTEG